jgi:hypothetical protein
MHRTSIGQPIRERTFGSFSLNGGVAGSERRIMSDPVARERNGATRRETAEERAARVDTLRRAYLNGTLVPTFPADHPGIDRLLEDLVERGRRRR